MNDPFASQQDPSSSGGLDLDDIEDDDGNFEPLPAGKYLLKCTDLEMQQSAKGDDMWVWEFEVVLPEEHSGRKMFNRTVLIPQCMPMVKRQIVACLIWKKGDGKLHLTPELAIGKHCGAKIKIRKYKDKDGNPGVGNDMDPFLWEGEIPCDDDIPY